VTGGKVAAYMVGAVIGASAAAMVVTGAWLLLAVLIVGSWALGAWYVSPSHVAHAVDREHRRREIRRRDAMWATEDQS